MKSKTIKSLLGFVSIFFLVITGTAWAANLEVHILSVRHGDCQLIVSPTGKTVLVDAGDRKRGSDTVIPYLDDLGITNLDYITASHYHADHIGGIDEVITGLGGISHILSAVYDRGGGYDSGQYTEYENAVEQKRMTIAPGDVIDLGGGATLTCIAANGCTQNETLYGGTSNENNLGVVLRLDYRDFQMCLGGDIEDTVESGIPSLVGDVDVYKAHHHGSNTSSKQGFLDVILPEISTISVGNRSGFPDRDVLDRLAGIGSYVYQTAVCDECESPGTGFGEVTNGNFKIETDGFSYTVSGPTVSPVTRDTDGSHECGIPIISLNRTQLNYGSGGGAVTASQTFLIGNTGCGTLNWTVTHDAAWLNCSPDSGTGPAQVAVSVDTAGLTVGTYTGTITVTGAQASNSPQTISVTLNVYGYDSAPFGEFAGPIHGSTVSSSVPVTGWALDDVGIDNVKIYRDPVNGESGGLVYIGDAVLVEGARPDIETAYPQYPMSYKAGWGYMMLTNFLPNSGNGTFVLYAVATDVSGHQVTLGSATVTCDNANAVKPFGAIDTPLPGGEASGGTYKNNGWVLTPMPNKIPEDGSTIAVYIDGVFLGRPTYNIYRSDIEMLFPGYANSDGAGASFTVDTTAYSDGLHTIAWVAEDDAGNADGIGSRYFTVQNSAQRSLVNGHWSFGKNNLSRLAVDDSTPVRVKRGYNPNTEPIEFYPTPAARGTDRAIATIEINELERVEIWIGARHAVPEHSHLYTGYQIVGNQLKPLPIGSTLDAKRGVFYWQPGPGFTGQYEFIFLSGESSRIKKKNITITIVTDRELP